jgi:AcrR family transcriptional regulator
VVLQAARRVFFRHGFSAATTDMIQREAGVSKSTLYVHFRNKEGLFSAVIRSECRRQIDGARLRSAGGQTVRARLTNLARAYLGILMKAETVALYRIVLEVSTVFPHLAELFYDSGPRAVYEAIEEILVAAIRNGELKRPRGGTRPAAQLFAAMVRGEPYLDHVLFPWKKPPREELEAWVRLAVDSFLSACAAQK